MKPNRLDHVALPVTDVAAAVDWYTEHFDCDVAYQDETWATLQFDNIRLALVIPQEHPGHIAVPTDNADAHGAAHKHRDGTRSAYVKDPFGNVVEYLEPAPTATASPAPAPRA